MTKLVRGLLTATAAISMTVCMAVSASAKTQTYPILDKTMTATLDVSSTSAYASTSINASSKDSLVSASIYSQYYAAGTTTLKNANNGNGGGSFAQVTVYNGNSTTGYGTWYSVYSVNTASYTNDYDHDSISKNLYW